MRREPATLTALPPFIRSRKGIAFTTAAAEGRLKLQQCAACGHVCYPPREACPKCWCLELPWKDLPEGGMLLAESTLRTSFNAWFQEHLPWRIGTVKLDAGPVVLAHVHGEVPERSRVRMIARTDTSGQGVLMALPEQETPNMTDDRQLRTLTCHPGSRRVLITDGCSEAGQSMAKAFAAAGASSIYLGIVDESERFLGREALEALKGLVFVPLDVNDPLSAGELAARIGSNVDILVNTARHEGPGSRMDEQNPATARDEMEINYFGLLRLIQSFAPVLRLRKAENGDGACAWVNLFSVHALSNASAQGTGSASQAAAYSLSQCLRADMAGSGVKVVNVLFGPLDDAANRHVPPPKVTLEQLAEGVVEALGQGIEDLVLGPVAEDLVRRYREDPMVLH
ncbi:MAG: SDR family NAD(P)-dependent oxidoreductase, partial [Lysobacterales bacterium]